MECRTIDRQIIEKKRSQGTPIDKCGPGLTYLQNPNPTLLKETNAVPFFHFSNWYCVKFPVFWYAPFCHMSSHKIDLFSASEQARKPAQMYNFVAIIGTFLVFLFERKANMIQCFHFEFVGANFTYLWSTQFKPCLCLGGRSPGGIRQLSRVCVCLCVCVCLSRTFLCNG